MVDVKELDRTGSRMHQINLGPFLITVDEETHGNLQDPNFAEQYLRELEAQLSFSQQLKADKKVEPSNKTMIWTSKKPTEIDVGASSVFLKLRKHFKKEFEDKKNNKNQLWLQIATKMNSMGYFVGEGVTGREKCRQKFMNLQATFFKYKDQTRQTGEGFVKKPPFYEELEEILGDTHKASPVFVIDSSFPVKPLSEIPMQSNSTEESQSSLKKAEYPDCSNRDFSEKPSSSGQQTAEQEQSSQKTKKSNRFTTIKKSVRPRRTVLTTVENMIKEEIVARQQQFEHLLETINQQNQQRHQQMMNIIDLLKEQKQK